MMRQPKAKLIFCLTKARAHVLERREKSKEWKRKKEKEKKAKPRYVFVLNSWVFWIPKVLVGELFFLCLGFCGKSTQTLELLRLCG